MKPLERLERQLIPPAEDRRPRQALDVVVTQRTGRTRLGQRVKGIAPRPLLVRTPTTQRGIVLHTRESTQHWVEPPISGDARYWVVLGKLCGTRFSKLDSSSRRS